LKGRVRLRTCGEAFREHRMRGLEILREEYGHAVRAREAMALVAYELVSLTFKGRMIERAGEQLEQSHRSSARRTTWFPSTSRSIFVFRNVSTACSGVITIGSFSLKDVLRRTGTPVRFSNSLISR